MTWVLFYDGDCAFCRRSVRRVARWDRRGRVFFASLQGELARHHGLSHYADEADGSLVVLREADGMGFTRSDAVLELARALGGCWRVFTLLRFVPQSLRDAAYRWLARHRHRFADRSASCAVPDPQWARRWRN